MKRLSLILTVAGLLSFTSSTWAQDEQASSIKRPCAAEELLGRPTLKRQSRRNDPNAPTNTAEVVTDEPCQSPPKETRFAQSHESPL